MKAFALVPLLFAQAALAVPAADLQTALGEFDLSGGVFGGIAQGIEHAAESIFHKGKQSIEKWVDDGKEFIKQNGLVCEYTAAEHLSNTEQAGRRARHEPRFCRLPASSH